MFRRTLLFFILLFVLASQEHLYAQCYPAYSYSKKVSFRNTGSALTDFQVKVEVNTQELISAGQMLASGNDIRFTDASCNNLSYWIESGINTANTIIWVKVNSLPANAITILTMYYGNPSATAASNGAATFESFDDFESGALSGWTTIGTSSWTIADYGGSKRLKGSALVAGSGTAAVKYTGSLTDYAVEMDYLNDNSTAMGGPLFEYTDNDNYYAIHSMTAPANQIMHSLITKGGANYSKAWSYAHNNNIWYKWSIEHTGSGSAIYFDNHKIADLPKVYNTGAGVWGYATSVAVIYFDNFRVRKLSPANIIERLTGPVVSSLNPATHTSDISKSANLTMEFITDIKKGTGNITIYKADDNSIIEQISVNSSNVTISGSTVTIDPAADLPSQTEVYVLVDAGAFLDLGDISFAGISGMHTWMFETSITKIDQQISFAATNNVTYGDADFDPGATSDNSSIPVTYTSSNTAVATIVDGKVHILKAGTTTITATQAGDATHNPAADQTQTLTIQPKSLALTLNATPLITKVYDGNMNATLAVGNYILSGIVGSDEVSASGTASYADKNVGTAKNITVSGITLSGAQKDNYNLATTSATTTGNITAKPLSFVLIATPAITKEYDGTTAASLAAGNFGITGLVGGDQVTITGTASYDNKNAGTGKTITVTDPTLSGTGKDNYTLGTTSAGTTGAITTRSLTVAVQSTPAISKVYNGVASASLAAGNYILTGVIGGETVAVIGSATFDNETAGTGKTVTVNNFILSGADKNNYTVSTNTASTTGEITTKPVTITLNASPVITKVYDGTATASLATGNFQLSGVVSGDDVSASGTASYDTKQVGTGKTITVTNLSLQGTDQSNYSLTTTSAAVSGSITTKPITASLTTSPLITKEYDGNTSAVLTEANYTLSGILNNDEVKVSGTASYDNKNTGNSKTITVTSLALDGADKLNYDLTTTTTATSGDITAKAITLSLNSSPEITRVYDGTNNAALAAANYSLTGTVGGDLVSVSGNAKYEDAQAGNNKTINVEDFILAGAGAGNYTLSTATATTTGNITARELTLTLNSTPVISKEYDGATGISLAAGNYQLSGVVGNDDVLVSGTADFDNKNAGSNKTVTAGSFTLSGADKANYSLTTQSANTTGSISRKALMITADDKERFAGTPNPAFTESYSGFVSNEGQEVLITGPVLSTTATQASLMGEYPIEVSGADAANYEISYTAGTLTVKPGAPTAINFSQAVLPENKPAETLAGMLGSLSDDPSATFTFTLVSGDGDADNQLFTINGDKLISNASFNYEERSTYTVRVRSTTQYGLWLEKPVTVAITDVNEIPTLDQPEDKTLCFVNTQQTIALAGISAGPETNQTTTLSVKSDNNALFESLTVSGTGATGEIRFTIKANVAGTALVSVKVKDNGGTEHDGTDEVVKTLRITVNPNPVFTINSEKGNKLSKGNSSQLTITGSDIASIQWSPSAGLNDPQNLNPVARPLSNTDYSVTATSDAGCTATGSISITVEDDLSVIAPKAIITPNGDGVNDRFVIENIDAYPNNRLQVFDRSGKLVYEKQNYANNWDGKIQNRALVNDTYFYVLTVNGKVIKKGSVTIIK